MPKARPECRYQAPQPRSGAPKAQGLIAVLRPQHNPPCRRSRSLPLRRLPITFHQRRCTRGASASVSNLHQLDGRDLEKPEQSGIVQQRTHPFASFRSGIGDDAKHHFGASDARVLPEQTAASSALAGDRLATALVSPACPRYQRKWRSGRPSTPPKDGIGVVNKIYMHVLLSDYRQPLDSSPFEDRNHTVERFKQRQNLYYCENGQLAQRRLTPLSARSERGPPSLPLLGVLFLDNRFYRERAALLPARRAYAAIDLTAINLRSHGDRFQAAGLNRQCR
jgi:hypothetical protein